MSSQICFDARHPWVEYNTKEGNGTRNEVKPYAEQGQRLAAFREVMAPEVNQQTFANAAGVNPKSYSQCESGSHRLSVPNALKLNKAYGLSLDFVYLGTVEQFSSTVRTELVGKLRVTTSSKSTENGVS